MRRVKELFSAFIMLLLTCCTTANDAFLSISGSNDPALITQTDWVIRSVEGLSVARAGDLEQPSLVFDTSDRRYAASVGCNRIAGGYAVALSTLTFTQSASSLRACSPDLQTAEAALVQALDSTASWRINGSILSLLDQNANVVLSAAAAGSEAAAGPTALIGTWRLSELDGNIITPGVEGDTPHITFQANSGMFSSTTGCNRLAGNYFAEKSEMELTLGPTTLRNCSESLAEREQQYIAMLATVDRWNVDQEVLTLRDYDRAERAKFVRQLRTESFAAAPGATTAAVAANPADFSAAETYLVKEGDSYWSIAQSYYGSGFCFSALAEVNRAIVPSPQELAVGQTIVAPNAFANPRYASCNRRSDGAGGGAALAAGSAAVIAGDNDQSRSEASEPSASDPAPRSSPPTPTAADAQSTSDDYEAGAPVVLSQTEAAETLRPALSRLEFSGSLRVDGLASMPSGATATIEVREAIDQSLVVTERLTVSGQANPLPFSFAAGQPGVGEGDRLEVQVALSQGGDVAWVSPLLTANAQATGVNLGEIVLREYNPLLFASAFQCGAVRAEFGVVDDRATLRVANQDYTLERTESASGARYVALNEDDTSFWNRGDRALLTLNGVTLPECTKLN